MNPTQPDELRSNKRILCVDDEPAVRQVVMLLLRKRGYEVEGAPDGAAAWALIAQDPEYFDVVITDNQMPRLSGIELVEKLRANGFSGKILFFSSTLVGHAAERLEKLRVDAVIEKGRPFTDLFQALEQVGAAR